MCIPILGYGAKTFKGSSEPATIFPMSLNMNNPFIANHEETLNDQYSKCLQRLQLDVPVKVAPLINFLKLLAMTVREKQEKEFS